MNDFLLWPSKFLLSYQPGTEDDKYLAVCPFMRARALTYTHIFMYKVK